MTCIKLVQFSHDCLTNLYCKIWHCIFELIKYIVCPKLTKCCPWLSDKLSYITAQYKWLAAPGVSINLHVSMSRVVEQGFNTRPIMVIEWYKEEDTLGRDGNYRKIWSFPWKSIANWARRICTRCACLTLWQECKSFCCIYIGVSHFIPLYTTLEVWHLSQCMHAC